MPVGELVLLEEHVVDVEHEEHFLELGLKFLQVLS